MRLILTLIFLTITIAAAEKVSYENYKVFRMVIKKDEEMKFLKDLVESRDGLSFWSGPSISIPTDIMSAPKALDYFTEHMNDSGIKYEKFVDNVEALIERQKAGKETIFGWNSYHTLDEIYDWLDSLPKKYSGKVETIIGGHTYEGRDIKGVKISHNSNNPGIFIEGGIHAWEWVSPATVTFLINELLSSDEPAIRELAESYDWYIFPSINPDGYVYTHTSDRMWSKSRSKSESSCFGADLNRNWNYKWMLIGASNDSCDRRYAGAEPFSEIETKTLSEYMLSIKDKLFCFINFHSFSQLIMVPYGYTKEHLENYNETYSIAVKAAEAISKRYGSKYTPGSLAEIIYPVSGASLDWAKAVLKLPLAFAYELRDRGDYGMLLPPEQIIPTGQEVIDSLIVLFKEGRKLGYP